MRRIINDTYQFNNSLLFDGVNDYCEGGLEPDNLFDVATGWTVAFWIRWPGGVPVYAGPTFEAKSVIWDKHNHSASQLQPGIIVRTGYYNLSGGASAMEIVLGDGTGTVSQGRHYKLLTNFVAGWNHVIIRCTAGATTSAGIDNSMLNGVAGWSSSNPSPLTGGMSQAAPLWLSRSTANLESFVLDDFCVFGRYLSDTECLWLWNNQGGNPVEHLGAELWYAFNETGGTVLADSSPNGYDATLINFADPTLSFIPH